MRLFSKSLFLKSRKPPRTVRRALRSLAPAILPLESRQLLTGGPDITFNETNHFFSITGTTGNDAAEISVDASDNTVVCKLTSGGVTLSKKVPQFKSGAKNVKGVY